MKLTIALDEIQEVVDFLSEETAQGELSLKDMYDIALKLQENAIRAKYNELFASANVVDTGMSTPSALEKIAMELENINLNS